MPEFENVVIGAGIVGLAVAKQLSEKKTTLLIEKNNSFGEEVSARNSEVIHSGIYYQTDSLKAFHCIKGKELLYDYCKERSIPHKKIGKLIVGGENSKNELKEIYKQGIRNGLRDLEFLDREGVSRLEPELDVSFGILSPSTGIIDTHSFMLSLLTDAQENQAEVLFKTEVVKLVLKEKEVVLEIKNPDDSVFSFSAKNVIVATGLHSASLLDRLEGINLSEEFQIQGVKGNYYSYQGKSPFSRLIYPLPDKYGLGIHSTLDMSGKLKFGPDVDLSSNSLEVNTDLKDKFSRAIKSYWKGFDQTKLVPDYAGLRPKIVRGEEFAVDFAFQTLTRNDSKLLFLHGIESPGLTSSLSISQFIANVLDKKTTIIKNKKGD